MRNIFALLALLACSHSVLASEDDLVILTDQTALRGAAIEIAPGRSITLLIADGTRRVIDWADVQDKRGPSFDALVPTLTMPGPNRVPVDIASVGAPLRIGQQENPIATGRHPPQGMYEPLCMTPCRLYLPTGYVPLVADGDHIDKHSVDLSVPPGGLQVGLRAPKRGWGYVVALPIAILGTIVGAGMLDDGLDPGKDKHSVQQQRDPATIAIGGAVLGGAIASAIVFSVLAKRARGGVAWQRINTF